MINEAMIKSSLEVPPGWQDTPEQALLRNCLREILTGHDEADTIRICYQLITLMRDQLMTQTAHVRRQAAAIARQTMSTDELVNRSGQTRQTVNRLLTEARGLNLD